MIVPTAPIEFVAFVLMGIVAIANIWGIYWLFGKYKRTPAPYLRNLLIDNILMLFNVGTTVNRNYLDLSKIGADYDNFLTYVLTFLLFLTEILFFKAFVSGMEGLPGFNISAVSVTRFAIITSLVHIGLCWYIYVGPFISLSDEHVSVRLLSS